MDGGDGVTQKHRAASPGDERQRVEARGLRRNGLHVELEDDTVGHPVVPGGVDLARQLADVIEPRHAGEKREHAFEPTDGRGLDRRPRPLS